MLITMFYCKSYDKNNKIPRTCRRHLIGQFGEDKCHKRLAWP